MKVFVSYSWNDVPTRRAVVSELRSINGIQVLYDREYLIASDQIHPGVSRMLSEADCVVVILTNNSLNSPEVLDELSRANERGKKIIPLVHNSVDRGRIPHFLRDTLQLSYEERSFDQALDRLIFELNSVQSKAARIQSPDAGIASRTFPRSTVTDFDDFEISWLQRSNLGRELLEQVITMCKVFRFSVNLPDRLVQVPLFISPNTFLPDDWTLSLIDGLVRIPPNAIEGKIIVEIGVGTGVIPITLYLAGLGFKKCLAFDIDTLSARVAKLNVEFHGISDRVHVRGGGSIFEPERGLIYEGEPYADLVVANIPQVPSLSTGPIRDQFDYYPMPITVRGKEEVWAMQGLWLVAQILQQAKARLLPGGSVVVNIGGRPTRQHIEAMFEESGYKPIIVHRARIQQDPDTDISALAYFERTQNIQYDFYTSKTSRARISASVAHDRLANGQVCYHDMYVIRGIPTDDT